MDHWFLPSVSGKSNHKNPIFGDPLSAIKIQQLMVINYHSNADPIKDQDKKYH
jgi:hypothetical protein